MRASALRAPSLLLCSDESRGELVDLVGPESGPMILVGDDDRRLQIAEGFDALERVGVLAHVNNLVVDSFRVQRSVRGRALDTRGLAIDKKGLIRGDLVRRPSVLVVASEVIARPQTNRQHSACIRA